VGNLRGVARKLATFISHDKKDTHPMAQLATIFLNVLVPVFLLVGLGYLAGPRSGLDSRTLSRFAYFILISAYVFDMLSTAHIGAALAGRITVLAVVVHLGSAGGWLPGGASAASAAQASCGLRADRGVRQRQQFQHPDHPLPQCGHAHPRPGICVSLLCITIDTVRYRV